MAPVKATVSPDEEAGYLAVLIPPFSPRWEVRMVTHRLRDQRSLIPQFEPSIHPSAVGPWTRVNTLQQDHQVHTRLFLIAVKETSHLGCLSKGVTKNR